MAGSGPQQTSPPHAESVNVDQQDEPHNPERENHVDNQREGSSRTIHAGRSGYRRREFRPDRYNNNRPRRDYTEQQISGNSQVVGAVFREPVHRVLEKVKNEPFFK